MQTINVDKNSEGQRFDKYLKRYFKEAESSFIYKMLRKKNIVLNGKKAGGTEILKAGDIINTFFSEETFNKFKGSNEKPENINIFDKAERAYAKWGRLKIIFENDHVLFVDKPVGLITQQDENNDISLNEWLLGYLLDSRQEVDLNKYKPSVCNRLDRNTSGLVLCAKTYAGSRFLTRAIKEHLLTKEYMAVCQGIITEEMKLEGRLVKNTQKNLVHIENTGFENSTANIKTIIIPENNNGKYTRIRVQLITGKTHQIRAHLSSIGHPLAGDIKYGGRPYGNLRHQLLCAYRVKFDEALTEMPDMAGREFKVDLPAYFNI